MSGNGQNFSTNFTTSGNKTITVSSGGETATCNVQINTPPNICVANTNVVFTSTPPLKNGNNYSVILSWATTGNNPVKITMTHTDNYNQTPLATGNTVGTLTVQNLTPGKAYVFYLSDSACNSLLLSTSVIVPTEFIPPIIPVPPLPSPVCFTQNPNIFINQTVSFSAQGGNGNYTWSSANSNPNFGQGQNFSTNFAYPGNFTITVQSNGQSANCFVNVQANQPTNPVITYQIPPPPPPAQVAGVFIAPKTGAETNAFSFAGILTLLFAIFKQRKFLLKYI